MRSIKIKIESESSFKTFPQVFSIDLFERQREKFYGKTKFYVWKKRIERNELNETNWMKRIERNELKETNW